ncbi:MAG: hypothetical protein HY744_05300 [Deltaproteobacteria bacterium]|nr:hypothetical protein [Deltaproteobacteria bacterium]
MLAHRRARQGGLGALALAALTLAAACSDEVRAPAGPVATTATTGQAGGGGTSAGGGGMGGGGGMQSGGAGSGGGQAGSGGAAVPVADFELLDVNAHSKTFGQKVSPRDFLEQVSGWFFGTAT